MLLLYSFSSCRSGDTPDGGASLTPSGTAPPIVSQRPSCKGNTFRGGKKLDDAKHSETSELSEYVLACWYACYFFVFTSIDHTCIHVYAVTRVRHDIVHFSETHVHLCRWKEWQFCSTNTTRTYIYRERDCSEKIVFQSCNNKARVYIYA